MRRPAEPAPARETDRRWRVWALRAAAAVEGLWCALRAPAWIGGSGLRALTSPPVSGSGSEAPRPERERYRWGRGSARRALRLLARLPASPWRDTCLYRSVAACLMARRCGLSVVLALGVRRAGDGAGPVEAHAWVETPVAGDEGPPFRRFARPSPRGTPDEAGRCR